METISLTLQGCCRVYVKKTYVKHLAFVQMFSIIMTKTVKLSTVRSFLTVTDVTFNVLFVVGQVVGFFWSRAKWGVGGGS